MARNIEIKARIESIEAMRTKVAALADHGPIELLQDDTFFTCARGRLKLRALSATEGQLTSINAPNHIGPKESFFLSAPSRHQTLCVRRFPWPMVKLVVYAKHRTLYRVGRTRVHLDCVEELGHFLELEVLLSEGEQSALGVEEAHKLMAALASLRRNSSRGHTSTFWLNTCRTSACRRHQ